ncbi:MAG: UDP-galactopyranose mutase [Burkholderia sp.]|jgi:UDP-galactopyranose mutase
MKKSYDYLIVGSGLFGSVFANLAKSKGKRVLVIEKRHHTGGNIYCENIEGINVHKYGAHIFHTSNKKIWNFVNKFVEFNNYINSPVAIAKGKLYNLPFNMNTFYQLWGVKTPSEAKVKLAEQIELCGIKEPQNLEEQALKLVGKDIYEILIKEYTEKQWGKSAKELPAFIIKRLPVRLRFDNNYFNDRYQGIPIGGYNKLIDSLLDGIEVKTGIDYNTAADELNLLADKILYTGKIDEFFHYDLGYLGYRSLRFETEVLDTDNFQGNAVVNYNDGNVPFTRIIEHKHFEFGTQPNTVITREYPQNWTPEREAYYPINDAKNSSLYQQYRVRADQMKNFLFGGRLAEYKYYDMQNVIASAMALANHELEE